MTAGLKFELTDAGTRAASQSKHSWRVCLYASLSILSHHLAMSTFETSEGDRLMLLDPSPPVGHCSSTSAIGSHSVYREVLFQFLAEIGSFMHMS